MNHTVERVRGGRYLELDDHSGVVAVVDKVDGAVDKRFGRDGVVVLQVELGDLDVNVEFVHGRHRAADSMWCHASKVSPAERIQSNSAFPALRAWRIL